MYIYFSEQSTLALIFLRIEKDASFRMYRPTKMTTLCRLPYNYLKYFFVKGCYVSKNSREGFWGKGAIETISQQLQKELPGLRGFSATNIKNMRSFYEEWSPFVNRQPMADENKTLTAVGHSALDEQMLLMEIRQPSAGEFQ